MKTKKAAKKAVKKSTKERAPRAASTYELTAAGKKAIDDMGPQQKLVAEFLAKRPATTVEIGEAIAGKLTTKQDPKRVAGFYVSSMKKDGQIKEHKAAKTAAAA